MASPDCPHHIAQHLCLDCLSDKAKIELTNAQSAYWNHMETQAKKSRAYSHKKTITAFVYVGDIIRDNEASEPRYGIVKQKVHKGTAPHQQLAIVEWQPRTVVDEHYPNGMEVRAVRTTKVKLTRIYPHGSKRCVGYTQMQNIDLIKETRLLERAAQIIEEYAPRETKALQVAEELKARQSQPYDAMGEHPPVAAAIVDPPFDAVKIQTDNLAKEVSARSFDAEEFIVNGQLDCIGTKEGHFESSTPNTMTVPREETEEQRIERLANKGEGISDHAAQMLFDGE